MSAAVAIRWECRRRLWRPPGECIDPDIYIEGTKQDHRWMNRGSGCRSTEYPGQCIKAAIEFRLKAQCQPMNEHSTTAAPADPPQPRCGARAKSGAMNILACILLFSLASGARAEEYPTNRLAGFDGYVEQLLKDWNAPAVGIGIVMGDDLVFAKGYGYRNYGQKLPFTPQTLCPIASNTKLFTAVAAGLLVNEGKLTWDRPIRESVPSIRFYNQELDASVTLRDMLSHRTGITRHDMIWYRSAFTRQELFERVRYLEPRTAIRQMFLYNNLLYAAAGYIIELQSGKTWEAYVREKLLQPLGMSHTVFTIAEMTGQSDAGVPFTEKRDTTELYQIPYYEDMEGVAPAGALISNVEEMSHWLIALMNNGNYGGKEVIPPSVLKTTLEPAMAQPNTLLETHGYREVLNPAYGMGRGTASYRGHLLTYHGGDINGFHSQVSFLPEERIGVIAFVIGDHCSRLRDVVSYNVYERLLGLDPTPWAERWLAERKKGKAASTAGRAKAGLERVKETRPSHWLEDYAGEYEHPAYGILKIAYKEGQLEFTLHKIHLPLSHFHYDRFDTPDDEQLGKYSVSFGTNPQGDIDKATVSLDEAEVTFNRRAPAIDPEILQQLAGAYETPTGAHFRVALKSDGLELVFPGAPDERLIPTKALKFRAAHFSDETFEFIMENGRVTGLKQRDPSAEYIFPRL
jgi:CubicO group peptidase (beta-lactamase class C family)